MIILSMRLSGVMGEEVEPGGIFIVNMTRFYGMAKEKIILLTPSTGRIPKEPCRGDLPGLRARNINCIKKARFCRIGG